MTRILITGAAGVLGRVLTDGLAVRGFALRLSDRRTDYAPPQGLEYHAVQLADRDAVAELCRDIDVVVHFGGVSTESSFEAVLDANLRGCFHVFEGARAAGVGRVVFASSNHAIGMYPRTRVIDASAPLRPDSYYGLSKAYGELLGQLYWDKHGLSSVALRIGSCLPAPVEVRHLSTWLSFPDLIELVARAATAPGLGAEIVYGVSANRRSWWRDEAFAKLGFQAQDDAERFAYLPAMALAEPDPIAARFQGGSFASANCTRAPAA